MRKMCLNYNPGPASYNVNTKNQRNKCCDGGESVQFGCNKIMCDEPFTRPQHFIRYVGVVVVILIFYHTQDGWDVVVDRTGLGMSDIVTAALTLSFTLSRSVSGNNLALQDISSEETNLIGRIDRQAPTDRPTPDQQRRTSSTTRRDGTREHGPVYVWVEQDVAANP